MKYTNEQREQIKRAFSKKDREKLAAHCNDARQIYNGLRRVSPQRAREIAEAIGRKNIIKVLIPELSGIRAVYASKVAS